MIDRAFNWAMDLPASAVIAWIVLYLLVAWFLMIEGALFIVHHVQIGD